MAITKVTRTLLSTGIDDQSNATAITIDSSENVGIKTTSPSKELDVVGTIKATGADNANTMEVFGGTTTNQSFGLLVDAGTSAADYAARFRKSDNTVIMEVSGDGNVGIGTSSPSSYYSNNLVVSCPSEGGITLASTTTSQGNNICFADGTTGADRYDGYIAYVHGASPVMKFGVNGGTERMRIDSSGNVGIGTSSPSAKLEVIHGNVSQGNGVTFGRTASQSWDFWGDSGANVLYSKGNFAIIGTSDSQDLSFRTNNTDRMRIHASGCVGIGSTADRSLGSNIGTLVVNGSSGGGLWLSTGDSSATTTKIISTTSGSVGDLLINQGSTNGGNIRFSANDSEKMRLQSNGRLLIGGTADRGGNLCIGGTSSTARVLPMADNVGYVGEATFRWQAIYAVNGSIQTSDEREKTEIKETTLGLDFIKDLKPVSYKWIDGEQQNKGKDEREHQGLIAQQVAETVEKHGIDKNTFGGLDIQKTEKYDDFHGMSYDQFVAPLIKAIQEQQTIIDNLKTRIETLESA